MLLLQQRGDIYRFLAKPAGGKKIGLAHRAIATLVVPISALPTITDVAYDATHVAFFPRWLIDLRQEDELHVGRRTPASGVTQPNVYVMQGVRTYGAFGLLHREWFVKERT